MACPYPSLQSSAKLGETLNASIYAYAYNIGINLFGNLHMKSLFLGPLNLSFLGCEHAS